jgi:hypothetical protein
VFHLLEPTLGRVTDRAGPEAATVLTLFAQMIIERGDSYRLEIWQKVLHMIADHPWIGHGYSASLAVDPGNGVSFQEPHSFAWGFCITSASSACCHGCFSCYGAC